MKEKVVRMKRKLFSVMLALAMVFTVLPFNKLVANAAAAPTPLTFTAEEANSTVTFAWDSATSVEYSMNGGAWSTYSAGTAITLPNVDDKVSFRGTDVMTSTSNHFTMTGKIAASGDVTSLTNGSGGVSTLVANCYRGMFFCCTSLTSAPELPATTLANYCYQYMFYRCTSLSSAPELPATALANNCYESMFVDCSILSSAPELPATTLADYCYYGMFQGCNRLSSAPALPATILADGCYEAMFSGCNRLISAPALPATTLADDCYNRMFSGCTSLLRAPALPATTLTFNCYKSMFLLCTNLSSVPELKATRLEAYCYDSMFKGCTNLIVTETTNASEATWIFPALGEHCWNDNMLDSLTAPGTLTAVETGKMYKVSYVVPLPTPAPLTGDYNKVLSETASQMEVLAKKLAAGEKVEDATVYLNVGDSLPLAIMKTLKNCPGVTLDFKCTYKGEDLHFVIKGGADLAIDENISWYGPLYLKSVYGVTGNGKQNGANTYVIKYGDTLNGISGRLGISIAELLKKNPKITNPDRIWAGQVLNY